MVCRDSLSSSLTPPTSHFNALRSNFLAISIPPIFFPLCPLTTTTVIRVEKERGSGDLYANSLTTLGKEQNRKLEDKRCARCSIYCFLWSGTLLPPKLIFDCGKVVVKRVRGVCVGECGVRWSTGEMRGDYTWADWKLCVDGLELMHARSCRWMKQKRSCMPIFFQDQIPSARLNLLFSWITWKRIKLDKR